MSSKSEVLIAGASGGSHIGASLWRAAQRVGIRTLLCDTNMAWPRHTIRQKFLWHYGGRRPLRMRLFEKLLLEKAAEFRPECIITTGMAPLTGSTIRLLRRMGSRCVNFSTDDPFNPRGRGEWFLKALPQYDVVFTPRRANEDELRARGCRKVVYLPFGYDDHLFHPIDDAMPDANSDLMFAGVGDEDRVPIIAAAISGGLRVRLYGINWDRFEPTRGITRGQADIPTLRRAISSCRIALCLVRRSNRDGHSMRTFEVPAVGACMVVEDTAEHRDIFGEEDERVCYFRDPEEMVSKAKRLLQDVPSRERLKRECHDWITGGHNTYADRLKTMLATLAENTE